jgi:hypothetical protein
LARRQVLKPSQELIRHKRLFAEHVVTRVDPEQNNAALYLYAREPLLAPYQTLGFSEEGRPLEARQRPLFSPRKAM